MVGLRKLWDLLWTHSARLLGEWHPRHVHHRAFREKVIDMIRLIHAIYELLQYVLVSTCLTEMLMHCL